MWNVEIEKIENGFLATYKTEYNDGTLKQERFCFEEEFNDEIFEEYKTNDNEKIAFSKMCKWLCEYFGIQYEKYRNDNLNIKWNKEGYKYDVPEQEN